MTTKLGFDCIGLLHAKFQISTLIKYMPGSCVLGTLIDTSFGDKLDNLKRVIDSGKVEVLLVDLLNNTAVRNNKLYDTEMLKGYTLARVNSEAKNWNSNLYKLIDKQIIKLKKVDFDKTRTKLSCLLEHNCDKDAAKYLTDYIRNLGYEPIDSPMNPSYALLDNCIDEIHGNGSRGESRSNDGASFWDANLFSDGYFSNNPQYALAWIHEMNGNYTGLKSFVKPRERRFFPTEDQFACMKYLVLHGIGNKPVNISGARMLKDRELWKTFAEDYKNGDSRGSKPMFISRSRADKIRILSLQDKQLGYLKFKGEYDGDKGYFRHYSGTGSNQTAFELLEKNGGEEWAILTDSKTKWIVNLVRRCGYYRAKP